MKELNCLGANRTCHHYDYFLLLKSLLKETDICVKYTKDSFTKFKLLFSKDSVVFLDIDKYDLLFLPIILVRSLTTKKNFAISVRTERLLSYQVKSFYDLIVLIIKRTFFFILKNFTNTILITTHNDQRGRLLLDSYVNAFIYDIQYWDIPYMNIDRIKPNKSVLNNIDFENVILIPGRFNEQKSKREFLDALETNKDLTFLIAGKVDSDVLPKLKSYKNILIINEYLSNEELFFLIEKSNYVYCYYPLNFDRPSGFFGRAIQHNRKTIVREKSYLSREFNDFENVISINSLISLKSKLNYSKGHKKLILNSSEYLKQLIEE